MALAVTAISTLSPVWKLWATTALSAVSTVLVGAALLGCGADTGSPAAPPAVSAAPPAADPVEAQSLASDANSDPLSSPDAPAVRRPRGLWVLCQGSQRVLDDPARIDPMLDRAQAMGVSDLFVQVYRGGRAWYDASLADASPYRANFEAFGRDPLRELIARAHARGLRVHAWVNVLSLSLNRSAALLDELGRDAVHVDVRGRSLLDYPDLEIPAPDSPLYRMGTRGVYLDPGAPGVQQRLAATFEELLARYPELDGLHLDYIRYPMVLPIVPGSRFGVGLDFGYGAATRERFRRETGLRGPYRGSPPDGDSALVTGKAQPSSAPPKLPDIVNANAWDAWRRDQVTELVRRIGERADAVHPEPKLLLSAAVISYADRAYLTLAQDWRRWLEDGLLDFAVPMVYTKDARLFRYQVEAFGAGAHSDHVWAGQGTWLFERKPEEALAQLAAAANAGLGGDALFSYDAIADSPALMAALTNPAVAVLANEESGDTSLPAEVPEAAAGEVAVAESSGDPASVGESDDAARAAVRRPPAPVADSSPSEPEESTPPAETAPALSPSPSGE